MIPFHAIDWDDPQDPRGNVRHIAEHDLTQDEVEDVLLGAHGTDGRSASSARLTRTGKTATGSTILVVYKVKQTRTLTVIRPITAYEVS